MSDALTSWPDVEIDGAPLRGSLQSGLTDIVVDNHLHLPDMFTMVFDDPQHDLLSQAGLKVGSAVSIKGASVGSDTPELLIGGEVTAVEADYDGGWDRTIVRGYDKSHRLHRGRRTETYQNVKVSDVAQTVASRAGLDIGKVDDSGAVLPFVSQVNATDWDFLKARARELGFEVGVFDGQFHFRKPTEFDDGPGAGRCRLPAAHAARVRPGPRELPAAGELGGAGHADKRPCVGPRQQGRARRLRGSRRLTRCAVR